jgi:hypothetical protein
LAARRRQFVKLARRIDAAHIGAVVLERVSSAPATLHDIAREPSGELPAGQRLWLRWRALCQGRGRRSHGDKWRRRVDSRGASCELRRAASWRSLCYPARCSSLFIARRVLLAILLGSHNSRGGRRATGKSATAAATTTTAPTTAGTLVCIRNVNRSRALELELGQSGQLCVRARCRRPQLICLMAVARRRAFPSVSSSRVRALKTRRAPAVACAPSGIVVAAVVVVVVLPCRICINHPFRQLVNWTHAQTFRALPARPYLSVVGPVRCPARHSSATMRPQDSPRLALSQPRQLLLLCRRRRSRAHTQDCAHYAHASARVPLSALIRPPGRRIFSARRRREKVARLPPLVCMCATT